MTESEESRRATEEHRSADRTTLTFDQLTASEPIYILARLVDALNKRAFHEKEQELDRFLKNGGPQAERLSKDRHSFHFLRALWQKTPETQAAPAFSYSFFRERSFDPELVQGIKAALCETGPDVRLAADFKTDLKLQWEAAPPGRKAFLDAIRGEKLPSDSGVLHNALLMLRETASVSGGIQGALFEHMAAKVRQDFKAKKELSAYLVVTLPKEDDRNCKPPSTSGLPDVRVFSLRLKRPGRDRDYGFRNVRPTTLRQSKLAEDPLTIRTWTFLDRLFRDGTIKHEGTEQGEAPRPANQWILFFPVFDEIDADLRARGSFLGWCMRFLVEPGEGLSSDEDVTRFLEQKFLVSYYRRLAQRIREFLPDLHQFLRDDALQAFGAARTATAADARKTALEALVGQVRNAGAWASVSREETLLGDDVLWRLLPKDERGARTAAAASGETEKQHALLVSLEPSCFDVPADWGLDAFDEGLGGAHALRLVPRDRGIILPQPYGNPNIETYYERFALRVREQYREILLSARQQKAAMDRLRADLSATLAHSFIKHGRAIGSFVKREAEAGQLRQALNKAHPVLELFDESRFQAQLEPSGLSAVADLKKATEKVTEALRSLEDPGKVAVWDLFFDTLDVFDKTNRLLTALDPDTRRRPAESGGEDLRVYLTQVFQDVRTASYFLVEKGHDKTERYLRDLYGPPEKSGGLDLSGVPQGTLLMPIDPAIARQLPSDVGKKFVEVYPKLRRQIFVEVLLNALSNKALGVLFDDGVSDGVRRERAAVAVCWDEQSRQLSFTNVTRPGQEVVRDTLVSHWGLNGITDLGIRVLGMLAGTERREIEDIGQFGSSITILTMREGWIRKRGGDETLHDNRDR